MLGTTLGMTTLVIEKKISWPTLRNTTEEVFSLVMYSYFPREQLDEREEIQEFIYLSNIIEPYHVHWARTL